MVKHMRVSKNRAIREDEAEYFPSNFSFRSIRPEKRLYEEQKEGFTGAGEPLQGEEESKEEHELY